MKNPSQKIVPYLWFDSQAEEAARFYIAAFGRGRITAISRYTEAAARVAGRPAGSALTVSFGLAGYSFVGLNGGPLFPFTPAVSFFVTCRTAGEADGLWNRLSEGGSVMMPYQKYPFAEKYGWLKDRYGLTWQIMLGRGRRRIAPCLMFTGKQAGRAEEAMHRYASIFPDSAVAMVSRYAAGGVDREGTVNHGVFSLAGQEFMAMDSALDHGFTFSEAVSLLVNCRDQREVDHYWDRLTEGGEEGRCGWLKDRYGVSWQIFPVVLGELLSSTEPGVAERVTQAFLPMKKLEISVLEKAAREK